IARDKAEAANIDNVGFECASIDKYDQPDESLDAVMGHSILHLLDNREQVIAKFHRMLKPGGVFVTSTACIGESMKLFRLVAPILTFLGLIPLIGFFTVKELEASMTEAGFKIDYNWQPGKNKAVFIVASKAGSA
ncbi:MAG: class I SAM-dependent methyltransferase, partial [Proteobacteria bacterium]|nr:class I SAM-dependent methyltransferase [Pseudomonadota bacterium]